jgi:hypothetical protein
MPLLDFVVVEVDEELGAMLILQVALADFEFQTRGITSPQRLLTSGQLLLRQGHQAQEYLLPWCSPYRHGLSRRFICLGSIPDNDGASMYR